MTKIERNIADWFVDHLDTLAVAVLLAASLLLRGLLFPLQSERTGEVLLPWFEQVRQNGGLRRLGQPVGSLLMLQQTCMALLNLLPVKPLYAYKLFTVGFDYLAALAVFLLVRLVLQDARRPVGLYPQIAALLTLFAPPLVMDTVCLAQGDSVYAALCLLTLLLLLKDKPLPAFILYGISLSFKLQSVFLLPFLLFLYLYKKNFSLLHFLAAPATVVVLALPNLLQGRGAAALWTQYAALVENNLQFADGYRPFWYLPVRIFDKPELYELVKNPAICTALLAVCVLFWAALQNQRSYTQKELVSLAFLSVYTVVFLLPCLHEGFDLLYYLLAIVLLVLDKKTALPFLLLTLLDMERFGSLMFAENNYLLAAVTINLGVYLWYLRRYAGALFRKAQNKEAAL